MKKLLKTALALFFALTICFPEIIAVSAEAHRHGTKTEPSGRERAIRTSSLIRQYPHKKRKLRVKVLEKRIKALERERESYSPRFSPEIQSLISETQFMCVCPTLDEFFSVCESCSDCSEMLAIEPISYDELIKALYRKAHLKGFIAKQLPELQLLPPGDMKDFYEPTEVEEWMKHVIEQLQIPVKILEGMDRYPREKLEKWSLDATISSLKSQEKSFLPIRFFEKRPGLIFCVAYSGKGSELASSFCTQVHASFKNLKHVLICGICGCPNADIPIGDILLSKKYVKLQGTSGVPQNSRKPESEIAIRGTRSYYEHKETRSYEQIAYLLEYFQNNLVCSPKFHLAANYSFDNFIEDAILSKNLLELAKSLPVIIDMEGVTLASMFDDMSCDVVSIRFKSDGAGTNPAEFSDGKSTALRNMQENISSIISAWIEYKSKHGDFTIPTTSDPNTSSTKNSKGLKRSHEQFPIPTPPTEDSKTTSASDQANPIPNKFHVGCRKTGSPETKSLSTPNLPYLPVNFNIYQSS